MTPALHAQRTAGLGAAGPSVRIRGYHVCLFEYVDAHAGGQVLRDLVQAVRARQQWLDPIERAALFHNGFDRSRPFRNGNGRMARARMTRLLRRDGFEYEMPVLKRLLDEDRAGYILWSGRERYPEC